MKLATETVHGTERTVWLEPTRDGVAIVTVDTGEAPRRIWGRDEYEFRTDVAGADVPALIRALSGGPAPEEGARDLALVLLADRYRGNATATDDLRAFCAIAGVPSSWQCWSSED